MKTKTAHHHFNGFLCLVLPILCIEVTFRDLLRLFFWTAPFQFDVFELEVGM